MQFWDWCLKIIWFCHCSRTLLPVGCRGWEKSPQEPQQEATLMHAEVESKNKPCELLVTHQPQQTPKTLTSVTGSSLTMTEPFQNEATTEWPLKVWTSPNRSPIGPAEIPAEKKPPPKNNTHIYSDLSHLKPFSYILCIPHQFSCEKPLPPIQQRKGWQVGRCSW